MEYKLISPINKRVTEIGQILMNRGIPLIDVQHYLNTTDDDIYPSTLIKNLDKGAQMLIEHVIANDNAVLQIDSDCDGFTSFAVFMNYFNRICPAWIQNHVTYMPHKNKHHGIVLEDIPEGTKLVIALDASSNEYEIHNQLKERGIDVLVIDHHLADHESESACVLNNQLCDYPNKALSGVGMVYKFCCFFDAILGDDKCADDYLDLVALGLVGDMMDLRSLETKHLINKGFAQIRSPFIKEMMTKNAYNLGDTLTPMGVAFYIVPYINAIARVGTYDECLLLAESMLEYRAYEQIPSTKRGCKGQTETRVEQAVRTSANVRNRQNKSRDASLEYVDNFIKEHYLLDDKILTILVPKEEELNTNITGLIANQAAAKYQHPVLILNERDHDGEDWWEGSARGLSNCVIESFRDFLLSTGLVEYAEGHDNAFGVGIKGSNIPDFIMTTNELLKDVDFSPRYVVDFVYSIEDLDPNFVIAIGEWSELWGQEVTEPYVAITGVKVTSSNVTVMKGSTLKIQTPKVDFIKFRASEEEINNLQTEGCLTLTIIGRCNINTWGGRQLPQIFIEDYEITQKMDYYY